MGEVSRESICSNCNFLNTGPTFHFSTSGSCAYRWCANWKPLRLVLPALIQVIAKHPILRRKVRRDSKVNGGRVSIFELIQAQAHLVMNPSYIRQQFN
jgi:hypothetical protein